MRTEPAVIDVSLVIVTFTGLVVPVIAPDQPTHGEPAAGVAVRVATVPDANDVPVSPLVSEITAPAACRKDDAPQGCRAASD